MFSKFNMNLVKLRFYNNLIRDTFLFVHPFLVLTFLLTFFIYFFSTATYTQTSKNGSNFLKYQYLSITYTILFLLNLSATFLGAFWAYYDFNWNGWWIWDSIEIWMYFLALYNLNFLHNNYYLVNITYAKRQLNCLVKSITLLFRFKNYTFLIILILFLGFIKFGVFNSIHNFVLPSAITIINANIENLVAHEGSIIYSNICVFIQIISKIFSFVCMQAIVWLNWLICLKTLRRDLFIINNKMFTRATSLIYVVTERFAFKIRNVQICFNYLVILNFLIFSLYLFQYPFHLVKIHKLLMFQSEISFNLLENYCNYMFCISLALFYFIIIKMNIHSKAKKFILMLYTYYSLAIVMLFYLIFLFNQHFFSHFLILGCFCWFTINISFLNIINLFFQFEKKIILNFYFYRRFVTQRTHYFQTHSIIFLFIGFICTTWCVSIQNNINFTLLNNWYELYQTNFITLFNLDERNSSYSTFIFFETVTSWTHIETLKTVLLNQLCLCKNSSTTGLYLFSNFPIFDSFKFTKEILQNLMTYPAMFSNFSYTVFIRNKIITSVSNNSAEIIHTIFNTLGLEFFRYCFFETGLSLTVVKHVSSYIVLVIFIYYCYRLILKLKYSPEIYIY